MDMLGVNLAGAEFGSVGQPYGTGYTYPTHAEIDYYAASGMNVIRLPFLWERLQPTLDGALDKDELARIDDVVSYATAKGLKVDLDVHNYGKFDGQLIGSAAVPTSAFADLWGKLAGHFAQNTGVMFGLMNEPQQSDATTWLHTVNAAIDAIRSAGASQEVLVPGINWDGAWTWAGTPNATVIGTGVVDPLKNYAFEVHQYLDSDGSGTRSDVASAATGVTRLQGATQWAEQSGQKLFLGEFGVATDSTSLAALKTMLAYMNQHGDAWQGATYWAGGPWWWGSNIYGIEPNGLGTATVTDQPQMAILKQFEETGPVDASSGGSAPTVSDPGPQQTTVASVGSLEAGQTAVIGTAAPGVAGQTLILQQTGGSGTLSLGPVQADGTAPILVAAPSSMPTSALNALTYVLTDSQSGATTNGSANVAFDAGPTLTATTPPQVGEGKTVVVATVAPGLPGDTLHLAATGAPSAGTLALDGTSVTYTAPQTVAAGQTDSFSYVIRDQHDAATANGMGSVRLDAGPTTSAVSVTVGHDRTTDLTSVLRAVITPGLAGDTLTLLAASAAKATPAVASGTVNYTSLASGSDDLTFVVGDQLGDTARGTATITVDPGPTTGAVDAALKLGASIDLTSTILRATTAGIGGDRLLIQSAGTAGTLGSVSVLGGHLVYTAVGTALSPLAAGSTRSDQFSYTISDQYGDVATGRANLSIRNPARVAPATPVPPAAAPVVVSVSAPVTTSPPPPPVQTVSLPASDPVVPLAPVPLPPPTAPASLPAIPVVAPSTALPPPPPTTATTTLSFVGYNHTISLGNGAYAITAGLGSARVTLGNGDSRVTLAGFNNGVTAGHGNDVVTGGLGSSVIALGNGNNAVTTSGYRNEITVGSGSNTIVAGSGSDAVTAGGGTNAITLAGYGNTVILNGGTGTVSGSQGSDTFLLNGGHQTVATGGWNEHLRVDGPATADITDLGHGLKLEVASSTQTDTVTGFGDDGMGIITFIGSAGGFSSVNDVMNALGGDGHGGTLLSLGKAGSIDLVGTAPSLLHANNFRIG